MVWREFTDHLEVLWGALAALGIVLLLTPVVGRAARYLRLADRPHEGDRARHEIPRLGGLALFFGILVPSLAFLPLGGELRGVLLGACVATIVGAVDDFRGLNWWQKLGGQGLAAAIPTTFGVWVQQFTFPIVGIHALPAWFGVPLTIIGIVALMNMVNFLDGLDGLAAGVCAISGATFCVIELSLGRIGAATLAAPVLDTSFVVAKRLKNRQPIYVADARHLHHRFMRIGFSQRRAVVYLYAWCVMLALAALATRFAPPHHHGRWSMTNLAIDALPALA